MKITVIVFFIFSSVLKKKKKPIVGISNNLKKIKESWKDAFLFKAKNEINIIENQNKIENKNNLFFKKKKSFFKIKKTNKKYIAQDVIIKSGKAGPVISKNGTSIKIKMKILSVKLISS